MPTPPQPLSADVPLPSCALTLTRVPVEEILLAKREEEERQKLKAKLSKQMNSNDLFEIE